MPSRFLALLTGVLLALNLTTALAEPLEDVLEKASSQRLHEDPYWKILLRYEEGSRQRPVSLVRQPAYFQHPDGARNPEAELRANIHALYTDSAELGDRAFACRFPARAHWLRSRLPIAGSDLSPTDCQALDTWVKGVNPQQATLIFAADYMNNPSSMFGHTLLRIDAPDQNEETRLLAYAINYAAQTDNANSLSFAWKGVTGGYPGAFSILPYYQKVKEYNDFENRDLWEYRLNLSPDEVRRMLWHLWELKGVMFPYYFFSSNCSYQLLGLIEAARPGLSMRRDFPVYAAPTDTLRRVLDESGMLKEVVYRPASGTLLDSHARANARAVNQAAITLADNPAASLQHLDTAGQARALEMGYDWLYYRFLAHKADPDSTPARLRQLLIRRSTYSEPDNRRAPPRPATDPANGHRTMMWQLAGGYGAGQGFLALDYRPAYHDLLDPPGGYRDGAAIDFLHGQLQYRLEDQELALSRLTLVHIDSMAASNDFLQPKSWNLELGMRQAPVSKQGLFSRTENHAVGMLEGGMGKAVQPSPSSLCYGMAQGMVEFGQVLDTGVHAGLGARLGCRGNLIRGQWLLSTQNLWMSDSRKWRTSLMGGYQWNRGPHDGIRLEAGHDAEDGADRYQLSIGWRHYH